MEKTATKPLVSICIPAFNREASIVRALESALHQTYPNIEVIVSDNASTDCTGNIVRAYAARDSRIKYFRNEKNIGSGRNFLKCFEYASGEFVQGLGDDDWLSGNRIEEGVKQFSERPDIAAAMMQIVTLSAKDDSFAFVDETSIKPGIYGTDWFFAHTYRHPHIGGMGFISLLRREDAIKALEEALADPTSNLVRGGVHEPIDGAIFWRIAVKYKTLAMGEKGVAYVKTIHGEDHMGLQGDFFKDIEGRLRYLRGLRNAFESFYRTQDKLRRYVPNVRFSFGLGELALAVRSMARGIRTKILNDYTIKEKLRLFVWFPCHAGLQALKRLAALFRKKVAFLPDKNYFLTMNWKFKAE